MSWPTKEETDAIWAAYYKRFKKEPMNQPPIIKPKDAPSTWRSIIVALKVTVITVLAFFLIVIGGAVVRFLIGKLL